MPAASLGERQLMLAGKVDRRHHIGHIPATGDQSGMLLNHPIIDPSRLLITSIASTNHLATHARGKLLDGRFL